MAEPKILLLDYEVSTWLAECYGPRHEPIVTNILRHQIIMCIGYQWYGEKSVHTKALCDFKGYTRNKYDDKALITFIRDLINKADIIAAYNGKRFDFKQLTTRLLFHRVDQHKPVAQVDPYAIAASKLYLPSKSLNELSRFLGLGEKEHLTPGVPSRALSGSIKDWKLLVHYCKKDTALLTGAYRILRPLASNAQHPNINLYTTEKTACPRCSSTIRKPNARNRVTASGQRYDVWQCLDCGKYYHMKVDTKGPKILAK